MVGYCAGWQGINMQFTDHSVTEWVKIEARNYEMMGDIYARDFLIQLYEDRINQIAKLAEAEEIIKDLKEQLRNK